MTTTKPTLPDCTRCGHGADWHRLDDSTNIGPADPDALFRCLGEDFDGCAEACPDFVCSELDRAVFAVKAAHPEVRFAHQLAALVPEHLRRPYWASKLDELLADDLAGGRGVGA